MRVSRQVAQQHREAIVAAAAAMIGARGPEAPSVAEIMGAAGLTHGGFYGHFASRQALMAEAVAAALARSAVEWRRALAAQAQDPLGGLVSAYLDGKADGDGVAALAGDMARADAGQRAAFTAGLLPLIALVAGAMPEGTEDAQGEALGTIAAMVGALVMARAVDDPELAEGFRAAGRRLFGL